MITKYKMEKDKQTVICFEKDKRCLDALQFYFKLLANPSGRAVTQDRGVAISKCTYVNEVH